MAENGKQMSEDRGSEETDKKEGFFKKHKVLGIILIVVILIAIFFGAIFGAYTIFNKKVNDVQIPNLVGMNVEDAVNKLTELNLQYLVQDPVFSDTVSADAVISQEPPYQESYNVKEGSTVSLVVSKGKDVVVLPDVTNTTSEDATNTLTALGLNVNVQEENNDTVEVGLVTRQEPEDGVEVAGGSTVTIYVSKGVKTTTVPDVVGKSLTDAKKAISDAKLNLSSTKTDTDTTKDDGVVLKQSLDSGKEVEENTEITLTINKLPTINTGKVNINVLSFTGFKTLVDPETNEIMNSPENVDVVVKVTSQGIEDTVYDEKVSEDVENLSVDIQGVGTVTVKVLINGVLQKTSTLNLNDKNPVLNVSK